MVTVSEEFAACNNGRQDKTFPRFIVTKTLLVLIIFCTTNLSFAGFKLLWFKSALPNSLFILFWLSFVRINGNYCLAFSFLSLGLLKRNLFFFSRFLLS
jgi:hypothetical protein